jgi:hypothetical protein
LISPYDPSFKELVSWRPDGSVTLAMLLPKIHLNFKDIPAPYNAVEAELEAIMLKLDPLAFEQLLKAEISITNNCSPEVKIMQSPEYQNIIKNIQELVSWGQKTSEISMDEVEKIRKLMEQMLGSLSVQIEELNEQFFSKLEQCNVIQQVSL